VIFDRSDCVVRFENVGLRYGLGPEVLQDITFDLPPASYHFLLGPSGAGKSSLLRLMYLAMKPSRGLISLFGRDIATTPRQDLPALRRRIGVVFQEFRLLNHLTAFDNVALPLRERGGHEYEEIRRRVREQLEVVGLEGVEARMPAELSGGMRKRVGLARAIIAGPSIVLYDEPTSGLDPVMSRAIDRLIRELQARLEVTSIVVTHDLRSAFAIGDRVGMLLDGRILAQGTPREFADTDAEAVREFMDAQFGEAHAGSEPG